MQVSLPRAALLLSQGTGRLIRSIDDRGVVAILDSRIVTKRYGSILLNSMPPFYRTSDGHVVKESLKRLDKQFSEQGLVNLANVWQMMDAGALIPPHQRRPNESPAIHRSSREPLRSGLTRAMMVS